MESLYDSVHDGFSEFKENVGTRQSKIKYFTPVKQTQVLAVASKRGEASANEQLHVSQLVNDGFLCRNISSRYTQSATKDRTTEIFSDLASLKR